MCVPACVLTRPDGGGRGWQRKNNLAAGIQGFLLANVFLIIWKIIDFYAWGKLNKSLPLHLWTILILSLFIQNLHTILRLACFKRQRHMPSFDSKTRWSPGCALTPVRRQ